MRIGVYDRAKSVLSLNFNLPNPKSYLTFVPAFKLCLVRTPSVHLFSTAIAFAKACFRCQTAGSDAVILPGYKWIIRMSGQYF